MAAVPPSDQEMKALQQRHLKELTKLQTIVRTGKWTPASLTGARDTLVGCIDLCTASPLWEKKNGVLKDLFIVLRDATRSVVTELSKKKPTLGLVEAEMMLEVALAFLLAGRPAGEQITSPLPPSVKAKVQMLLECGWVDVWLELTMRSTAETYEREIGQLPHFASRQLTLFMLFAHQLGWERKKPLHECATFFVKTLFRCCDPKQKDKLLDLLTKTERLRNMRGHSGEEFFECVEQDVIHGLLGSMLPCVETVPEAEQLPDFTHEEVFTFHSLAAKILAGLRKDLQPTLDYWGDFLLRIMAVSMEGPAGMEQHHHLLFNSVVHRDCGEQAIIQYGGRILDALEADVRRQEQAGDRSGLIVCQLALLPMTQIDNMLPMEAMNKLRASYLRSQVFAARTINSAPDMSLIPFGHLFECCKSGVDLTLEESQWILDAILDHLADSRYGGEQDLLFLVERFSTLEGISLEGVYRHPTLWKSVVENLDFVRGRPVDDEWYMAVAFPVQFLSHIARTPAGCREILARPGLLESVVDVIHAVMGTRNHDAFEQTTNVIVSVLLQADSLSASQREWICDLAQCNLIENAWTLWHYVAALALPLWPESERRLRVDQLCGRLAETLSSSLKDSAQLEYATLALWTLIEFVSTLSAEVKAVVRRGRTEWVAFCEEVTSRQESPPNAVEAATETLRLLARLT